MDTTLAQVNVADLTAVYSRVLPPLKQFEERLEQIETTKKNYKMELSKEFNKYLPIVILIPICALFLWFLLLFLAAQLRLMQFHRVMGFFLVVLPCSFLAVGLPFLWTMLYVCPLYTKDKEKASVQLNEYISRLEWENAQIVPQFYDQLVRYVPRDYQYSDAIQSFQNYLINQRAHTLTEAINLYEEELHRMRLENMQMEMLREQKKQTVLSAVSAAADISTAFSAASAASSLSSINSKL